jgi:hypothetical protein
MIQVKARRRFDLTIHQQVWAMVERLGTRQLWMIMDAAGQTVATAADQAAAVALAKQMIRDGRMPEPAAAHAQLERQIQHVHDHEPDRTHAHESTEPMEILEDRRETVPVGKTANNNQSQSRRRLT